MKLQVSEGRRYGGKQGRKNIEWKKMKKKEERKEGRGKEGT